MRAFSLAALSLISVVVFRLAVPCPAVAGNITTLASFTATTGGNPICRLVRDDQGNLYGTTTYGGADGLSGTVFKLIPTAVPEPSSLVLMGLVLMGVAALARWRL